ncbi:unannotated protein [freshwater metagenome]|uniref:Unannotated protein n=1 Tax=freshwater metagenome TaxID=449393 RepID=A0A6J7EFE9_9ZZZZ
MSSQPDSNCRSGIAYDPAASASTNALESPKIATRTGAGAGTLVVVTMAVDTVVGGAKVSSGAEDGRPANDGVVVVTAAPGPLAAANCWARTKSIDDDGAAPAAGTAEAASSTPARAPMATSDGRRTTTLRWRIGISRKWNDTTVSASVSGTAIRPAAPTFSSRNATTMGQWNR